jgi:hypothetical protein
VGGLFQNGIIRKYCCGFGCGCGALTTGATTDAASATAATTIIVIAIVYSIRQNTAATSVNSHLERKQNFRKWNIPLFRWSLMWLRQLQEHFYRQPIKSPSSDWNDNGRYCNAQ